MPRSTPTPEDPALGGEALLSEADLSEPGPNSPLDPEPAAEIAPEIEPDKPTEPAPSILVDEFHGQGGSYLRDPETGVRTLISRTLPPTPPER